MKTAQIAYEYKHGLEEIMGYCPLWVGRDYDGEIIAANSEYEDCERECIDLGYLEIVYKTKPALNAWDALIGEGR